MKGVVFAAVLASVAVIAWPARPVAMLSSATEGRRSPRTLRHSDPEAECLEVLDALVTVLRAGSAVGPALVLAVDAPIAREGFTADGWRRLRGAVLRDVDVAETWRVLGETWHSAAFADVAAAWQMSVRHGCPIADALESAALSVRARRAHHAAVDAASAGAKASTGVLMGLPVLGVLLGLALGVDMLACYRGASGLVTLWPGLALMWVGGRWGRRLTASALRPSRASS